MNTTKPLAVRDSWVLVDTMVDTYCEIAEEAFSCFLFEMDNSVPRPQWPSDATAYDGQKTRKTVAGIKTIVFSAMALEAAAFEFATIQLGERLAKTYLDKLDVVGKWLVIPRLVCGRSLHEDGPAINGLKSLVRARNALVHHKSKEWDRTHVHIDTMDAQREKFEKLQVPNAFKTLILLSLELNAVLETDGPLPAFEDGWIHATPRNSLVEKVVHRCREVHRNNWRRV
ncbi:hypothetical protein HBO43_27205 [Pseudomonas veronii]|uniref:Uncharacterized protein n=1 Tax=Pseudomonas veronii TaxID=76761 RepID=A0A7Y0ZYD9_PSEVE|nr:hypothetical protein [Pseudomonas veronii]SEB83038.1 hypothetical protein SAMN04490199_2872 [Pseudomonas marginalis]KRP69166.1 hypothetical protein TU80_25335 [Pseudomonas veronii]NMY00272.1 hypothetical protein [Pseudomonas veronii]OPK04888.1 hypothetical protein BZ164_07930 [Pseudomonas veronii]CAD0261273.1 conserved hypothetical protein [Pseudomonas veronii]